MTGCFVKSETSNIVEMLRQRAAQAPTGEAYRFLFGKAGEEEILTYGRLDHRARAIGGWLRSRCGTGFPVALIFRPGLEYITAFYGALYGGEIAVPLNPPASRNSVARLVAVLASANCRLALTTRDMLPRVERALRQFPALSETEFVAVETIGDDASSDWRNPCTPPESTVVVQYTSGSTAAPKGVKLRDRNLLHNAALMMRVSRLGKYDIGVSWLPHYHDMGLIAGILMPAFGGFPVVLLSPAGFLSDPIRWLRVISEHRATVSGAPNFGYEECTRSIHQEEIGGIDLSTWRVAYCGAEPIRPDTVKRFTATFSRCGFREKTFFPCYGLAEATLMVTGGPAASSPVIRWLSKSDLRKGTVADAPDDSPNATALLASGALIPDNEVVIVNPESKVICEKGRVGEIWLSGPSVGDGYWGFTDATEEVFGAFLAETGAGPFLRTGDLGFVENGMLFVVGRRKDLIIIRGLNYYPQDIELTIDRCHPSLVSGCGAAFSVDVDGEERLAVVHEVDRRLAKTEHQSVIESVVESVAEQHGLSVYAVALIKQGSIAKTTSGKVQRQRNRSDFLTNQLLVVSQWRALAREDVPNPFGKTGFPENLEAVHEEAEIERCLIAELSQLLEIEGSHIDPQDSIFDLGVDSLVATQLQNRILLKLNVKLTQSEIMRSVTVSKLSSHLLAKKMAAPPSYTEEQLIRIVDQLEGLSEERVTEMLRTMRVSGNAVSEGDSTD